MNGSGPRLRVPADGAIQAAMSRLRIHVVAALAATALLGAFPGPARAAKPYAEQVVERTLDNGLKILLLADHKAPVTVVQVWYRVGSRNETPGVTGLSHIDRKSTRLNSSHT